MIELPAREGCDDLIEYYEVTIMCLCLFISQRYIQKECLDSVMFLIIEKINNSADLTQPEVDKLKMCPQTADKMCLQGILVGNGSQWGTFNIDMTVRAHIGYQMPAGPNIFRYVNMVALKKQICLFNGFNSI